MPSSRRLLFAGLLAAVLAWRLVSPGNQPAAPRPASAIPSRLPAVEATVAATEPRAADPIADFESWLRSPARDLLEGERLARARRPVFQQLIATHPKAALARALSPEVLATLPPTIAAQVEQPVSGTGRLEVAAVCALPGHPGHPLATRRTLQLGERRYTVHARGRALAFPTQETFVANGIALGDELALAEPADSVRPAISASWTHGEKTVLWIRAEFSDDPGSPVSDTTIQQTMAEVNTFYADVSQGRCTLRTVILPGTLRLPFTKASLSSTSSSNTVEQQALSLARAYDAANGNTGTYHPDRVDRVIVIAKSVPSFAFGGVGTIGATGVYLNGFVSAGIVAHELGHNHGLQHAHAWRPSGASATGPGTHVEYGDPFDIMGSVMLAPLSHFNVKSKADLAYFDATNLHVVETAGTYRIQRHDHRSAEGKQALRVDAGDYEYWVEHRRLQNNLWSEHASRFQNGIQIRWGRYLPTPGGVGTYLLDGRPYTPDDQADAPVTLGETFTDLANGVSFTPVAVGGVSPQEWIDVRVDYGALPGSGNRNPTVDVELPTAAVPARTSIVLRAAVADPDSDTTQVRWDFGDGTDPQTGVAATHRFSRGGTFRIRCTVTDGKGGRASHVGNVTVDDPLQAWSSIVTLPAQRFSLAHNGREFFAIDMDVYTSTDGLVWSRLATLPNHLTQGVATVGTRIVAVGLRRDNTALGSIQVSPDGAAWQSASLANPPRLNAVAYGAGRFVAVGEGGAVLHSTDGLSWSLAPAITPRELLAIHFAADRFVAVGRQGAIITSRDGLVWENRSFSTVDLWGVTYFRGNWCANTNGSLRATNAEVRDGFEVPAPGLPFAWGIHSIGDELLLARGDHGNVLYSEDRTNWYTALFAAAPTNEYATGFVFVDGWAYLATNGGRIVRAPLRSPTSSLPQPDQLLVSQTAPAGQNVVFGLGPSLPGVTYQWYKDGQLLAGQTGPSLQFTPAQPSDAGSYHVTLTNFAGTTTLPAVTLSVDPNTARLVNLSVRTRLASASEVFTLGFVVGPSRYTRGSPGPKLLLARAAGPALSMLGVTDALPDPRIALFSGSNRLSSNDDWSAALLPDFQAVGAFSFPSASSDAALRVALELKPYTLQLTSAPGGTGEVVAELYDLDPEVLESRPYAADPARLINVSARGPVSSAAPLIGGFVLRGGGTRTLLIRAAGPALSAFGVAGPLAAPTVTVLAGDRIQATNTGWSSAPDPATLRAAAASVGAFPFPDGSRDSALLVTLPAGAYTAHAGTADGAGGTVLLEIYEVP